MVADAVALNWARPATLIDDQIDLGRCRDIGNGRRCTWSSRSTPRSTQARDGTVQFHLASDATAAIDPAIWHQAPRARRSSLSAQASWPGPCCTPA